MTGAGIGPAGGDGGPGGPGYTGGYGTEVALPEKAGEKGSGESFIPRGFEAYNPVLAPLTMPGLPAFVTASKVGHPGYIKPKEADELDAPEPDPDFELQEPPRKEPPKPREKPKLKLKRHVLHKPKPPKPPKPIVVGSLSLRGSLMMDPLPPKPKAKPKPKPAPKPKLKKKEPPKPKVEPKPEEEEEPDEDVEFKVKRRFPELAGDGSGILGCYYEGRNFERLLFRRADHNVEFDWRNRLPDPRMPRAAYSVRWTGKVVPRYSEEYSFFTASDDGSRLWVNGQKLVDVWQIQSISENKGKIRLEAGKEYDIRVEFFEKIGDSTSLMYLYWESPSQKREFIPESQLRFPDYRSLR